MIYADRNGNRTEKTTGQDRFLEYIYGHTLTRMMLKPLLGWGIPTWWKSAGQQSIQAVDSIVCQKESD